ncbi:LOW QUALITY PROTEIN: protein FAM216B [Elgaria multicarinata webbii]|uniref:LOW QUALITY PROTEIN: protein FAM216B n=1 Tax=Elgaria multicarinata webbii TaxID=159646 RepID=UPI002FCD3B48
MAAPPPQFELLAVRTTWQECKCMRIALEAPMRPRTEPALDGTSGAKSKIVIRNHLSCIAVFRKRSHDSFSGQSKTDLLFFCHHRLLYLLRLGNRIRMGEDRVGNPSVCHYSKLPCIRVPLSAQGSPLMKDLKRGQNRYFYSIMRIYDSKAPREMLYRRYVINLQRQNVLGLITKQQVEYYASYLKDSQSYRGSRLRTAPPLKADYGKAQLGLCN